LSPAACSCCYRGPSWEVWNLVSISSRRSLAVLSPSWLQAHGHAQIFGWIGTFIIGIGYYSLSKMGRLMPLLPAGLGKLGTLDGRRHPAVGGQYQRVELAPPAADIGCSATHGIPDFLRDREPPPVQARFRGVKRDPGVDEARHGFHRCLPAYAIDEPGVSISVATTSMHPEIPHWLDQRYLFLAAWGFPC
jgi:hypothetical protein